MKVNSLLALGTGAGQPLPTRRTGRRLGGCGSSYLSCEKEQGFELLSNPFLEGSPSRWAVL